MSGTYNKWVVGGGGVGGGGGWAVGGGLNSLLGPFGLAMSATSASHSLKHA